MFETAKRVEAYQTTGQYRAIVIPYPTGTLLLASDGLINYTARDRIAQIAGGADLDEAASAMVDAVRLKSEKFQDDVSLILCRRTLLQRLVCLVLITLVALFAPRVYC